MGGNVSYTGRSTPSFSTAQESTAGGMRPGMTLGQHVVHAKFGDGVVLNVEGQGAQARVQVNFDGLGSKWLMMEYAKLEVC